MTEAELRDLNKHIQDRVRSVFFMNPNAPDCNYKLVFDPEGKFLGVECGKVFIDAKNFDLAFV